jgi:hypothetical protein
MPNYVNRNAQPNGDHEVHRTDLCTRLPAANNQDPLGIHSGCSSAVAATRARGYRGGEWLCLLFERMPYDLIHTRSS